MRRLFVFCTVLAELMAFAVTAPSVSAGTFATATTTVQPLQATPAKTTREIFGYPLASSLGDPSNTGPNGTAPNTYDSFVALDYG